MAYCTTATFHDARGGALHTIRQGAIPSVTPVELCDRLLADAVAILEQRPDLRVVRLCDGAPEMRDLLRAAIDEAILGTRVYDLLDFWHVLEKLAPATQVVYGEARGAEVLSTWRLALLNRKTAVDDILLALTHSGTRTVRVGTTRPVHEGHYVPGEPSRTAGRSWRAPAWTPHREREHGSDLQDALHGADEAKRRAMEGSDRRRRDQPARAGPQ
jgi:hypothetical protein